LSYRKLSDRRSAFAAAQFITAGMPRDAQQPILEQTLAKRTDVVVG